MNLLLIQLNLWLAILFVTKLLIYTLSYCNCQKIVIY